LAGIRLEDQDLAAALGWPGRKELDDLHDAVILGCLYHRRRMDFDRQPKKERDREKGRLHLTGQWPGQLSDRAAQFRQTVGVDLMKVTTLFRIIDGSDSQASRAGSKAHVDLSLAILARDYRTAALRAEQGRRAFEETAAGTDDA